MRGRAGLVIAVVAVIALLLVGYFFAVRPQQNELNRVNEEIETEENRTLQLQAVLDRLQQLRENEPELRAALQEIRDFVPEENNVPNFIFQVQEAANAAGLRFVRIGPELPKPPPEGATLAEVRVSLGARGGYFAIQDFIRRLYRLDRALRIDILNLAGEEDPFRVTMEATARIFFELPEIPGAATAPTTGATPAPTPSPTPTPGG